MPRNFARGARAAERLRHRSPRTHRPAHPYTRPLAIQMEALLYLTSATHELPGIDKQLEKVLGVEREHWQKLLGALEGEAKKVRDRDMNRGIGQVTAVNGVPSRPSAERLLMADGFFAGARTARVHVDPIYRNLSAVYGQEDWALAQLEPDLIGEHQVASTGDVELIDGCLRWCEGEPEIEREQHRRGLLTVLQRATLPEHGARAAQATALLDHLVQTALTLLAADDRADLQARHQSGQQSAGARPLPLSARATPE